MYAFSRLGLHKEVIQKIVEYTGCETYLELGLRDGDVFCDIYPLVRRCIGVDIVDIRKEKVGEFYHMTTDEFFGIFTEGVDIIFIDADHQYEAVVRDFQNALRILNKYGIIFLHDTDPISSEYTHPAYCNDCYKAVDYIIKHHPELNIITLPLTEAGLSIVMRKEDRRVYSFQ